MEGKMGTGWSQEDERERDIVITGEESVQEDERERDIILTGEESIQEDERERDIIVTGEDSMQEDDKSILRESGSPPVPDQLSAGVLLNNRTMKHWVEKETKKNCFMIYARGLSIAWAEDEHYWQWVGLKDAPSDDAPVEVAELLNVCWLEVHGRFDVSKLSPGTTYEVVFVILVRPWGYGWAVPVSFRVTSPDGAKQEHKENLREKPRGRWIEIKAGELSTSDYKEGEMEASMFEQEGGHWKSGLVIKGVLIRPKN